MSEPHSVPSPVDDGNGETYSYYFDLVASRPGLATRLIAAKQSTHLRFIQRLASPASVLEIGPGSGWFARACQDAGVARYLGVESSARAAQALRDEGFDIAVHAVPPMPATGEPFDLVYMSHLVEHLPGPEAVLELLVASRHAVRPGGLVAVAIPNARALGREFWDCDYTHRWPSTARRMRQVAADAGLRLAAQRSYSLTVPGVAGKVVWALSRLIPHSLLTWVAPRRDELWFRARMLWAPDVLLVFERPEAGAS